MVRPSVRVVVVSDGLEQAFTRLWTRAGEEAGAGPDALARVVADGRMHASLRRPDVRVYVAMAGGEALGYVVLSHTVGNALVPSARVGIEQLYVEPAVRRSGVARQLLLAAAGYAESVGSDQVASTVPAHDRDANRFFARLGFGSQTVRRAVGTAALVRRLTPERPRSTVEQLLQQRRRSLRSRGAPVRPGTV